VVCSVEALEPLTNRGRSTGVIQGDIEVDPSMELSAEEKARIKAMPVVAAPAPAPAPRPAPTRLPSDPFANDDSPNVSSPFGGSGGLMDLSDLQAELDLGGECGATELVAPRPLHAEGRFVMSGLEGDGDGDVDLDAAIFAAQEEARRVTTTTPAPAPAPAPAPGPASFSDPALVNAPPKPPRRVSKDLEPTTFTAPPAQQPLFQPAPAPQVKPPPVTVPGPEPEPEIVYDSPYSPGYNMAPLPNLGGGDAQPAQAAAEDDDDDFLR
jgi:hypothetical protein